MNILTTRSKEPLELVEFPKGVQQFSKWGPFVIDGPAKVLILSDIHVPYQDDAAVRAAVRHGVQWGADTVLLNGDLIDFYQASNFLRDPRVTKLAEELKMVKSFLAALRKQFPKARIVFKIGNHEERWERYMIGRPELLGISELELPQVMNLEPLGIELVGDKRPIYLGKLTVIHGHEYSFAISNPVNPARGFFLKAKVHCLGGHLHQCSQHSETNLHGDTISTWSTGCLCDLHPAYRPINPWNHGFAMVEFDKSGTFHVENLRIIDGKVY